MKYLGTGIVAAALSILALSAWAADSGVVPRVEVLRLPERAIKPRAAVGSDGTLHVVFYAGSLQQGNVFYVRRGPSDSEFSRRIRVNNGPGKAAGRGPVNSPQMALGRGDRVHVAYRGSPEQPPVGPYDSPGIFHARLNDDATAFEPAQNVQQATRGSGQSVAADGSGNVWVSWFGVDSARGTEAEARMWVSRSTDGGRTFEPETAAWPEVLGACFCCATSSTVTPDGQLLLFYRSAGERRHRDMHLLISDDQGHTFADLVVERWEFVGCPDTGGFVGMAGDRPLAIWEADSKRLRFARVPPPNQEPDITTIQGEGRPPPRYPVAATNMRGETLIVWTEGVTAQRGGDVLWQLLDADDRPVGKRTRRSGVKTTAWSR